MNIIAETIVVFSALAFASLPAAASPIAISFNPTSTYVEGSQPVVIDVNATLANLDNDNPVFLNADNLDLSPFFDVTDDFFTNVPFSLDPGQVTGPITLFSFVSQPGTPLGSYTGTYELFGGDGVADQSLFITLETASFTVEETPEPANMLLTGSALVVLGCLGRRRKGRAK